MFTPFAPIFDRRVRIALIGCGRISPNHLNAIIAHHEKAELVALCDTNPARLEQAKEYVVKCSSDYSVPFKGLAQFTDYSQLLHAVSCGQLLVDIVVLATPSGLHPGQVIAAANIGIHVCTEKPMATRWSDGLSMVQACDDAGVCLFVVKQNRFNSTLQLLKKQLEAGRFGKLSLITVNVFWQRPQSYYDRDSWRGTWEFDGGALMNQASHYVDLLDWLIGPVESVSASIATLARDIEVEDTAALQLRWRSGALGTLAVTMLAFPRNLEGSITILGETGSVKVGGTAVNKIDYWNFDDHHSDDALVEQASFDTSSVYGLGHIPYYANLLETLQGKAHPSCDGREGLRSLELLIGAYRSARDGRTVHLPLEY